MSLLLGREVCMCMSVLMRLTMLVRSHAACCAHTHDTLPPSAQLSQALPLTNPYSHPPYNLILLGLLRNRQLELYSSHYTSVDLNVRPCKENISLQISSPRI